MLRQICFFFCFLAPLVYAQRQREELELAPRETIPAEQEEKVDLENQLWYLDNTIRVKKISEKEVNSDATPLVAVLSTIKCEWSQFENLISSKNLEDKTANESLEILIGTANSIKICLCSSREEIKNVIYADILMKISYQILMQNFHPSLLYHIANDLRTYSDTFSLNPVISSPTECAVVFVPAGFAAGRAALDPSAGVSYSLPLSGKALPYFPFRTVNLTTLAFKTKGTQELRAILESLYSRKEVSSKKINDMFNALGDKSAILESYHRLHEHLSDSPFFVTDNFAPFKMLRTSLQNMFARNVAVGSMTVPELDASLANPFAHDVSSYSRGDVTVAETEAIETAYETFFDGDVIGTIQQMHQICKKYMKQPADMLMFIDFANHTCVFAEHLASPNIIKKIEFQHKKMVLDTDHKKLLLLLLSISPGILMSLSLALLQKLLFAVFATVYPAIYPAESARAKAETEEVVVYLRNFLSRWEGDANKLPLATMVESEGINFHDGIDCSPSSLLVDRRVPFFCMVGRLFSKDYINFLLSHVDEKRLRSLGRFHLSKNYSNHFQSISFIYEEIQRLATLDVVFPQGLYGLHRKLEQLGLSNRTRPLSSSVGLFSEERAPIFDANFITRDGLKPSIPMQRKWDLMQIFVIIVGILVILVIAQFVQLRSNIKQNQAQYSFVAIRDEDLVDDIPFPEERLFN